MKIPTKLILLGFMLLAGCASDKLVTVRAITDMKEYHPGVHARTAFNFKMCGGWHIYWMNPGDAGMATSVEWQLPEGFGDVSTEYSIPEKLVSNDIADYSYKPNATIVTNFKIPSNITHDTTIVLTAYVKWLRCKEICIPGADTVQVNFPVTIGHGAEKKFNKDFYELYPLDFPYDSDNWLIDLNKTDTSVVFTIKPRNGKLRDIGSIEFFPVTDGVFSNSKKQILTKEKESFELVVPFDPMGRGLPSSFSGIFVADKPWEEGHSRAIKFKIMID